jgi:60 kDa SS-A/Ro ribonucleoprotein
MQFNTKTQAPNTTTNHEGAKAYQLSPKMELYSAVVTTALSDLNYEKADERLARIRELIAKNDAEFVARLAVYAREKMYLRSIPLVLAVELAKIATGNGIVSKMVTRIIQRADELTEILSYYQAANARTTGTKKLGQLSKQIQKGVADAFNKFDEYQFAKYNRDGATIKLRDALFLAHPKAKDDAQQAIFNKIAAKTLDTPYTWEVELSVLGQKKFANETEKKAAFQAKWEELVASGNLGYMALMRNLRNIVEANVNAATIEKVCATLTDAHQVAKSKQLPFRFLAAHRELKTIESQYTTAILTALEGAAVAATVNMKGFSMDTRVVIACDVSGSMQKVVSAKSKVTFYDIGLMLGMMLQSKCRNVETGMFGDTWKVIPVSANNILANVDAFYKREGEVGYSTNGYLVLDDLTKRNKIVDKVMLFTDCQMWNSNYGNHNFEASWMKYKKIAPNAKLYLFDLSGNGTTPLQLQANGVHFIAGWSDKIFEVLAAMEVGSDALAEIEKIEL